MNVLRIVAAVLLWALVLACDNSSFTGAPAAKPQASPEPKPEDDDDSKIEVDPDGDTRKTDDDDDDPDDDDDDDDAEPEWDVETNSDGLELIIDAGKYQLNIPSKCWFVVSGAYFGLHGNASKANEYRSTFPTPAGGEIKHGATFDTVGGVYLNAADEPYRYNQGDREIDLAIDTSFDSIGVAPGMYVEVRDGNDTVMYKGQGPYLALSTDHNENVPHVAEYLRDKQNEMDPWMVTYLQDINYTLPRMPLHAARYVAVRKIKDVPCE